MYFRFSSHACLSITSSTCPPRTCVGEPEPAVSSIMSSPPSFATNHSIASDTSGSPSPAFAPLELAVAPASGVMFKLMSASPTNSHGATATATADAQGGRFCSSLLLRAVLHCGFGHFYFARYFTVTSRGMGWLAHFAFYSSRGAGASPPVPPLALVPLVELVAPGGAAAPLPLRPRLLPPILDVSRG